MGFYGINIHYDQQGLYTETTYSVHSKEHLFFVIQCYFLVKVISCYINICESPRITNFPELDLAFYQHKIRYNYLISLQMTLIVCQSPYTCVPILVHFITLLVEHTLANIIINVLWSLEAVCVLVVCFIQQFWTCVLNKPIFAKFLQYAGSCDSPHYKFYSLQLRTNFVSAIRSRHDQLKQVVRYNKLFSSIQCDQIDKQQSHSITG